MLQENNGVVVSDGALEQAFGVVRGRGRHDLESGRVGEHDLDALRVIQPSPHASAVWRAHHHRRVELALGAVADASRLADNLVDGRPYEVGELYLGDGAHTVDGGSQRDAGNRRLCQRHIYDPGLAKLL